MCFWLTYKAKAAGKISDKSPPQKKEFSDILQG